MPRCLAFPRVSVLREDDENCNLSVSEARRRFCCPLYLLEGSFGANPIQGKEAL